MIKNFFSFILISIIFFSYGLTIKSETEFEFYLNDFFYKRNKAIEILKEVELHLKSGSKSNSCSSLKEAERLVFLANKSLIKAYKLNGEEAPKEVLKSNMIKWKSILENC
tara:strand:+ start:1743 stop:2072 length:330 start_codon:yes stop_codon:yes gene_type:complete